MELPFVFVESRCLLCDTIIDRNLVENKQITVVLDDSGSHLQRITSAILNVNTVSTEWEQPLDPDITDFQAAATDGSSSSKYRQPKIKLAQDKVIPYHPYRLSAHERKRTKKIIAGLTRNEILRESSPVLLVKRKMAVFEYV